MLTCANPLPECTYKLLRTCDANTIVLVIVHINTMHKVRNIRNHLTSNKSLCYNGDNGVVGNNLQKHNKVVKCTNKASRVTLGMILNNGQILNKWS